MKPSIGRIVHFVNEHKKCRAAIVTDVGEIGASTPVCLEIFQDELLFQRWRHNVPEDQTASGEQTWHWPERVE